MIDMELLQPMPPWFSVLESEPRHAYEWAWKQAELGIESKLLRGAKMRSLEAMDNEFGAVMQFPDYFGENWGAFKDCLTDLAWMPAKAYVLVIVDADQVLVDTPESQFKILYKTLTTVSQEWAEPISLGEWWDRPAIPFHVVMQVSSEKASDFRSNLTNLRIEFDQAFV